mmetsp:Transcript_26090/g.51464  ORF Transcript_26090/g.51464 Transcript_26090/m.51464 type:complete len:247 (-) Transcript_26090:313-1053(-)|eukprot:CAMPEP_0175131442 /NCGR_PEP_ID=MMETSP0087-20121206/6542_1 /TAXON_ID=136419 /ORGANISM="Unknown Unknown, Strain D1" /LENGTH=246 /DNA_ID=CAMNT_0016413727 /DNA_START=34 /DNA_END=774 /DNA_ORIENTATION=+
MSREIISPEGLRMDGRRPKEIRKIACELGTFHRADGSAQFSQGQTTVVASVYGPREPRRRTESLHDRCLVTCDYTIASFATGERKNPAKGDRRTKELGLVIKQTFESAILTHLFPRSQISIHVQVLLDDGGAPAAAINAVSLALVNAGIPMKEMVCACSIGYTEGTPLLDLNLMERGIGGPQMYIAIYPNSQKVATIQMESKLGLEHLEDVLNLGKQGCSKIYESLCKEIKDYSFGILHSRGFVPS